jgi:hypothetical protein
MNKSLWSNLILKVFVLIIFSCLSAKAQTKEIFRTLDRKIVTSDSVLLISHVLTEGYVVIRDEDWDVTDTLTKSNKKKKESQPILPFLINKKLNRNIIVERKKLFEISKNQLSNILSRDILLKSFRSANCDQPRHSIIIFKNGKESFIDICFGCRKIHTSEDIVLNESLMDEKKWNALEAFFKSKGFQKFFD